MSQKKITSKILKSEKVSIEKLTPFQGEAKKLTDENFNRLRNNLLRDGFAFPLTVWETGGKILIIDGHQRVKVMTSLIAQGYEIPPLNCVFIKCKDFNQAKAMVASSISQYGEADREGFLEFIGDAPIVFEDLNIQGLPDNFWDVKPLKDIEGSKELDESEFDKFKHKCPKCEFEWDDKK